MSFLINAPNISSGKPHYSHEINAHSDPACDEHDSGVDVVPVPVHQSHYGHGQEGPSQDPDDEDGDDGADHLHAVPAVVEPGGGGLGGLHGITGGFQ